MSETIRVLFGITIPFLGTIIGSGLVFIFKNGMGTLLKKFFLGFASGVMIA
jgi:ZIP family zinc transporter